jgi:hypothetical protein
MPLGEEVGKKLPIKLSLAPILIVAFILGVAGFFITFAYSLSLSLSISISFTLIFVFHDFYKLVIE